MKFELLKLSKQPVSSRYYENIARSGYRSVYKLSFKINDKEYSIEVYENGFLPKEHNAKDINDEKINVSDDTLNIIEKLSLKYCQNLKDKLETI